MFRSNFKGLCFFAVTYVKDYETAKELVQDSFITLWEKRDTIDLSKPVKTYLTTTIRNRCLNYLRDNKKFNNNIIDIESLQIEAEHADNKLGEKELRGRINDAIGELPEKCREIFVLSRYENMKYQQIADMLQISIKTVETQMSKALQHMRERLADYINVLLIILTEILMRNKF
ncbi:MAG: RNA polymerase sigma-70 factor [Bacteroidales bacterium]|nr:RNA polymerase sigma-70 factor [Bacteroidales bacterium]